MGIIVAIGGYQYESFLDEVIETPFEIDMKILELAKKEKPKVLFVPTASFDKVSYINSIKKVYQDQLSADFDALLLYGDISSEDIEAKIAWADVIYVGGGNTLMMINKWKELGVDVLLKDAYKDGKVLCGVSAGAICWFEYGVSDSLQFYSETNKYIKVSGLGILSGICCPHFKSKLWDKGHRTLGMKEIMKKAKGQCLAIPDGCAVLIEDGKYDSIGVDTVKMCYWGEEGWIEEELGILNQDL